MAQKNIIVVLGMHRSGTSVITRGLQVLGVDLGENLMPAAPGINEMGFWEDQEISSFNNALLQKLGSDWNRLNGLDDVALLGDVFAEERDHALALLKSKLHEGLVFAFKDPRTAILLPFWQEIFKRLGLSASYLIAVRNPMEVAESLHRRDGIALLKGMLLWVKYSIAAVRFTQGLQRVFVAYSAVMQEPRIQLKRVSHALELADPELNQQGLFEYTEEFLSPELRHNISAVDALLAPGQIPPFVSDFYRFLMQLAGDKYASNDEEVDRVWPSIEKHYADFVPLLNQFDQLENATVTGQSKERRNLDVSPSMVVQEPQPQFRTLRSFIDHLGTVYADFSRFIYRWNLDSLQEGTRFETSEGRMVARGWVVGNTSASIHIAIRQDGATRCYPLNVERHDVVQALSNENTSIMVNPVCGFSYAMKSDTSFEIGFEIDGWIFWLYSGEPAYDVAAGGVEELKQSY